MAQLPQFVFSPSTLLSAIGLMRGPDTTPATPARDWRSVTVDVVIPARNEQDNILRSLASVLRQTLRPRTIVVVDDGSTDATSARARAFADFHGADVVVIQRLGSIGKTPSIKDQARSLDSDVLFVLDADTVLESDNYIARTVEELYQGVGIASAWGSVQPLRERDRRMEEDSATIQAFRQTFHHEPARPAHPLSHRARFEWASGIRWQAVTDAWYQTLSDGNQRWEVTVAPRRSVARTERLNLDLGFTVTRLHTAFNFDHGYYDPNRYEYYAFTAYPYWKLGENTGVGVSLALGAQRDDFSPGFRPGSSVTVDATFGIYRQWAVKVNAAGIFNQRLGSGAFRGYGAGLSLVRRF